jgi:deoxyadenosine/deoxycytidine kinase
MKHPKYISVMGTMGSGKTTAARLIAKEFGFHLVEENFGENAFLPRFYARMKRWAFHSQTFFLMEKINQLMEIKEELEHAGAEIQKGIVQDTPIEQDVFSYAKAQYSLGNMDEAEWKLYQKIYHSFKPHLPKPDVIIYLDTSLPVVAKRIATRGRGYEKAIPKKYLHLLDTLNKEWIEKHDQSLLRIQTDSLNIVSNVSNQTEFTRMIKNHIDQM